MRLQRSVNILSSFPAMCLWSPESPYKTGFWFITEANGHLKWRRHVFLSKAAQEAGVAQGPLLTVNPSPCWGLNSFLVQRAPWAGGQGYSEAEGAQKPASLPRRQQCNLPKLRGRVSGLASPGRLSTVRALSICHAWHRLWG